MAWRLALAACLLSLAGRRPGSRRGCCFRPSRRRVRPPSRSTVGPTHGSVWRICRHLRVAAAGLTGAEAELAGPLWDPGCPSCRSRTCCGDCPPAIDEPSLRELQRALLAAPGPADVAPDALWGCASIGCWRWARPRPRWSCLRSRRLIRPPSSNRCVCGPSSLPARRHRPARRSPPRSPPGRHGPEAP